MLAIHLFSSLWLAISITTVATKSSSKPGCPEKCGNVTIPYPFGIGSKCSANSSFTIICRNFTSPPTIFLSSIKMEALSISLFGTITVKQDVSPMSCSDVQRTQSLPTSLTRNPFTFSARYNSLVVLGCKNSVWLLLIMYLQPNIALALAVLKGIRMYLKDALISMNVAIQH